MRKISIMLSVILLSLSVGCGKVETVQNDISETEETVTTNNKEESTEINLVVEKIDACVEHISDDKSEVYMSVYALVTNNSDTAVEDVIYQYVLYDEYDSEIMHINMAAPSIMPNETAVLYEEFMHGSTDDFRKVKDQSFKCISASIGENINKPNSNKLSYDDLRIVNDNGIHVLGRMTNESNVDCFYYKVIALCFKDGCFKGLASCIIATTLQPGETISFEGSGSDMIPTDCDTIEVYAID